MGRILALLLIIMTVLTTGLFISRQWFLEGISTFSAIHDSQFTFSLITIGLIFVLSQLALAFTLFRYGRPRLSPVPYTHGNIRLEIVWTGLTAVIFIILALTGQRVWAEMYAEESSARSVRIRVVAQQFQWNFHYSGPDQRFGRTSPELINDSALNFIGLDEMDQAAKDDSVIPTLALPLNRPIELELISKDVTHSFWVPNLRFKQDLVPGHPARIHFKLTRTGRFELACAELCGQLHFRMKSYLLALPENEYDALTKLQGDEFQARSSELLRKYN
jgi:cytochrome c oxidase subunit II